MFPARLESLHAVHLNDAKFEYARCSLHSEKSATCLSFVNGSARVKLVQLETARSLLGLPRWRNGREPACQCRRHKTDAKKKKKTDAVSIPGLGRSPGGGNGHPLQYSCLENSMDRGAWRATVRGAAKSQTQLSS